MLPQADSSFAVLAKLKDSSSGSSKHSRHRDPGQSSNNDRPVTAVVKDDDLPFGRQCLQQIWVPVGGRTSETYHHDQCLPCMLTIVTVSFLQTHIKCYAAHDASNLYIEMCDAIIDCSLLAMHNFWDACSWQNWYYTAQTCAARRKFHCCNVEGMGRHTLSNP